MSEPRDLPAEMDAAAAAAFRRLGAATRNARARLDKAAIEEHPELADLGREFDNLYRDGFE
jgi:hypothetical protein